MDRFRRTAHSIARLRQSRWLRWPGAIVTVVVLLSGLVGLPSTPDQLTKWGPIGQWLADNGREIALALQPLGADLGRWTLVVLGVLLLLYFYLPVGWRSGLRGQRDPGAKAASIEPTVGQVAAPPKTAGEVATELNDFRERAEQLRRDYETRAIPASQAAFNGLAAEVNAYLRENGLAKHLPKIEQALEIGFVPGSVYDHVHVGQGVDDIYEVDSPRGHEVRLGRLRDALAAVLSDLPHPEYPVSMADQAKRESALKSLRRGLRKRWDRDGPVPPPPQTVFPRVDPPPAPIQPSMTQPTPPSQSEPTSEDIEARAEFLTAQVQDVSMNTFGSRNIRFGMNQARIIARNELEDEFRKQADERETPRSSITPSVSQAQAADDLGPTITVVDPRVRGVDQPPQAWTAPFWQGKQILKCPWDDFRTISEASFLVHQDTHTEPPTDAKAQEVSTMPWPWAKTPLHYLGDGRHYISGVPADPDHTLYAPAKRAEELVAMGLYGAGPAETQEHAFSGAVGRTIVCKCGHESGTMAEFQSHLSESE